MSQKTTWILGVCILLAAVVLGASHYAALLSTTTPEGMKRRYEVLLPLRHNDGRPVAEDKLLQTLKEFELQFGGYTYAPHPLRGAWNENGKHYEDESALVYVDVPDTPANQRWFAELKPRLAERFEQESMYVTSHPIRSE
jgi:hypothetical protein